MMGIKRNRPEEIVAELRRVTVMVGQGWTQLDGTRATGVIQQTYHPLPEGVMLLEKSNEGQ